MTSRRSSLAKFTGGPGQERIFRMRFLVSCFYLFIKHIFVCNAQLMQKAQQRRYKTVHDSYLNKKVFNPLVTGGGYNRATVHHYHPRPVIRGG